MIQLYIITIINIIIAIFININFNRSLILKKDIIKILHNHRNSIKKLKEFCNKFNNKKSLVEKKDNVIKINFNKI